MFRARGFRTTPAGSFESLFKDRASAARLGFLLGGEWPATAGHSRLTGPSDPLARGIRASFTPPGDMARLATSFNAIVAARKGDDNERDKRWMDARLQKTLSHTRPGGGSHRRRRDGLRHAGARCQGGRLRVRIDVAGLHAVGGHQQLLPRPGSEL